MTRKAAMYGLLILLAFAVASCSNDSNSSLKDTTPPQAELLMPLDGSTREGVIDVKVDVNDDFGVEKVELLIGGKVVQTADTPPYSFEYDMSSVADGTIVTFNVRAFDTSNNKAESDPVKVTKGESKPPVATLISPTTSLTVMQGDEVHFEGSATDPEDGDMASDTISWSSNLQGDLYNGNSNKNNVINYRGFVLGTHTITMTAQDSDGNIDTKTVEITVTDNDKDYVYIQEGRYTVGPPLFQERSVIFKRPFIIAKKELSLGEFMTGLTDDDIKNGRSGVMKRKFYEDEKQAHPTDYPADYFTDWEKYADYPAVFIQYFEFTFFCMNLNEQQGYTNPYEYLDRSNDPISSDLADYDDDTGDRYKDLSKSTKVVLVDNADGWRMPTEAEWLVAAAGGNAGKSYPWGEELPAGRCNTLDDPNPPNMIVIANGRGLCPVDSYEEYRNAYGLYNVSGNASELTSDIFLGRIPSGIDYVGFSEERAVEYVVKGGAWYNYGVETKIPMRIDRMWFDPGLDYKDPTGDIDSGTTIRLMRNLAVGEAPW